MQVTSTINQVPLMSTAEAFANGFLPNNPPRLNVSWTWDRLGGLGQIAPRNFVLAAVFALHLEKDGFSLDEEFPLRLTIIACFGN